MAVACGETVPEASSLRPRVRQSGTLPDHQGRQCGERRGWAQKLGVKQAMSEASGLPQGPGHHLSALDGAALCHGSWGSGK